MNMRRLFLSTLFVPPPANNPNSVRDEKLRRIRTRRLKTTRHRLTWVIRIMMMMTMRRWVKVVLDSTLNVAGSQLPLHPLFPLLLSLFRLPPPLSPPLSCPRVIISAHILNSLLPLPCQKPHHLPRLCPRSAERTALQRNLHEEKNVEVTDASSSFSLPRQPPPLPPLHLVFIFVPS